MNETFGSGFGFGSYVNDEPKEIFPTEEMAEEPAAEDIHEFTVETEDPTPAPPLAPAPKYEISQRPLRPKKSR